MTSEELIHLLRLIEAAVPVHRWVVDGVQVWPLFRAQLMIDNFFIFQRSPGRAASAPRSALFGQFEQVARNAMGAMRARLRDREAEDRLRPVDALLYSDGVSFITMNGRHFDRFCDPIRERLAERGCRSLMVTPLAHYREPRHSPSVFIQPRLDRARLYGAVSGRVRRHRASLDGWSEAVRIARQADPGVVLQPRANLGHAAAYVSAYGRSQARMLDRTRPRVVFIVSYYGAEAMALIRECRRRGIVTVDVQHGAINEAHWAYADWSRLPRGGFELLPHYFWVWSETEASSIRRWSACSGGAHTPIVGGNLLLSLFRDGTSPAVRAVDDRFRALSHDAPPGVPHVLYTTNGFETASQLSMLRDAIGRSRGRLMWWIRIHPTVPQSYETVRRALAGADGDFRIDPGTDMPLYGLLRHVSVHVTEASSTVIEATELGVPSLLLSRAESIQYRDAIDRGWAVLHHEDEDFVDAICALVGTRGKRATAASIADPLDVVLNAH